MTDIENISRTYQVFDVQRKVEIAADWSDSVILTSEDHIVFLKLMTKRKEVALSILRGKDGDPEIKAQVLDYLNQQIIKLLGL